MNTNMILSFVLEFQPLMRRFQKTLKDHLVKQQEKVTLAMRELVSYVCNIIYEVHRKY